jgi:uncharacterized protein (TIGR03382 family)
MRLHYALTLALAVTLHAGVAQADDWPYAGHDPSASSRSAGAGAISSSPDELPGVAWRIQLDQTSFEVSALVDVDGDGVPEIIAPHRQRVAAFRVDTGAVVWTTPQIGVSHIHGVVDATGDGVPDEILAVDMAIRGGIHLIDATTGAVLWSYDGLARSSGAWLWELDVADIDGDGAEEAFFGPVMQGTPEFYAVDWSTVDGVPRVAVGSLAGTDVNNNRFSAGDFLPDLPGLEVAVGQGSDLDIQRTCGPTDAGASCDDVDGTFCMCHVGLFASIWFNRAAPLPLALDSDGDGTDEVLSVYRHSSLDNGFGIRSVADGMASGSPDSAAMQRWFFDYTPGGNDTHPATIREEPSDINGDETVDLLINLFNAGTDEVDLDGVAVDDGLANPGGFAVGAFDTATGALQASLTDRYVHGLADLDGDGIRELVVQTTGGDTFSGGTTEGWDLACDEDCTFELAWTAPNHRAVRYPEAYDGGGFPNVDLMERSAAAGGGLYLWRDQDLTLVAADGAGGVVEQAALAMGQDDEVSAFSPDADVLLIDRTHTELAPYDGALSTLAPAYRPQSQASPHWHAAYLGPAELSATPIVDGHVFWTDPMATSVAGADVRIGDQLLLADDLDGDGSLELLGFTEQPEGGFEITCLSFDGTATFPLQWTWSSTEGDDLAAYSLYTDLVPVVADVNGDGVSDLVLDVRYYSYSNLLVLDGASGALLMQQPISGREVYHVPPLVWDLIGPAGYGDTDGALDLLRPGRVYLDAYEVGATAPALEYVIPRNISRGAWTDLDGDGVPELIAATSQQFAFHQLVAYTLLPTPAVFWGPVEELPPPADVPQAISLADLDGDAVLDVVWISSNGRLARLSGIDGALLPDFPGHLSDGALVTDLEEGVQPLSALVTADIDGDGFDEAIVGSRAGYLYAVNVAEAEGTPSLEWGVFAGEPVTRLATADVDGDGAVELLVSTADGNASVLDGLGVYISIESPEPGDCITGSGTTVSGTSLNIDTVDLHVAGTPVLSDVVPNGDGDWTAEIAIPLVGGLVEIVAEGRIGGEVVTADSLVLPSDGDLDGDGVTLCGGDCDDSDPLRFPGNPEVCDGVDNDCNGAADADEAGEVDGDSDGYLSCDDCDDASDGVHPGAEEVCGDGIDQDCSGADLECAPLGDDDDDDDDDDVSDCADCDGCDASAGEASAAWLLALVAVVYRRRR